MMCGDLFEGRTLGSAVGDEVHVAFPGDLSRLLNFGLKDALGNPVCSLIDE